MVDTSAVTRSREPAAIRVGIAISDWTERWFPDAFVFALVGIVVVFVAGLLLGRGPAQLTHDFGGGFWSLIPFTMQMALIVIFGYVVASSPPVYRLVQWLATIPKTPRTAVAWIALFATASSLLSWGFSLVFSGLLVREVVRRGPPTGSRAAAPRRMAGIQSPAHDPHRDRGGRLSRAAVRLEGRRPRGGDRAGARPEHLQLHLLARGPTAALAAAALSRGRHAIRPRDGGRAHPVPVLRGDLRH